MNSDSGCPSLEAPSTALHARIRELRRYSGKALEPLEEHSAADSQTGAIGDIQIVEVDSGAIFEAVEVKHDVVIDMGVIHGIKKKIMDKNVDRYYVLTTHRNCLPSPDLQAKILQLQALYRCQIIVNGVLPSIRYYLRLLGDPSEIFQCYVDLLRSDKTVVHEHRLT